VEETAASPVEIDTWTPDSGVTDALTHFCQGKEGASLHGSVRRANDIPFNPEGTTERVERADEEQLEADDSDGSQASSAGERARCEHRAGQR
jgi:hypothetical protein